MKIVDDKKTRSVTEEGDLTWAMVRGLGLSSGYLYNGSYFMVGNDEQLYEIEPKNLCSVWPAEYGFGCA